MHEILAHPAEPQHPRTNAKLLTDVIQYIYSNGGTCAIAECANRYLRNNLELAGLSDLIRNYKVDVIDLDFEEVEQINITGEEYNIHLT